MSRTTNSDRIAQIRSLVAGLPAVSVPSPWVMDGVSAPKTQVLAALQAALDAADDIAAAKATYLKAKATGLAAVTLGIKMRANVREMLVARLGRSDPQIEQLGLAPVKSTPVTVKAGAVVKAQATRAVRHTMGKKQKAAVTVATSAAPKGL